MESLPDTQLFRDVFNASPIGIAVENLDGQLLFVNPAFCSMLGFSEEELRNKHCVDFSPPEDAEKDWTLFQQLRAGSIDHYQLEKRYFRRDGSLVWGRLSISLLNSHPSPLVVAMVEDITENKRAEEARFRHATIVESSEDAIASATLDGVIASWNAGAQRIFGYTESEVVGKSVTILVPPELWDEENKLLETLKAGGRIEQLETVRVTKTGNRINVSVSISPIKDSSGEIVGCSGIARDITERKQAEDKLREYERAVEGSEEMIAVVDREYRYLIANRQFLKMRNMRRERVVGHYAHEVLNKDFFEAVVKAKLDDCFEGKVVRYETKYSYPELGQRDLLVSYFPIEGASGIDRVACIVHDITDRKRSEEALAGMGRKLIQAHEEERTRIARELHDDINQKVALLAVNIQTLKQDLPAFEKKTRCQVEEICERVADLGDAIQALSHRLHSSKLEYRGLGSAAEAFCKELSARQNVEIDFHSQDIPRELPKEIALCLFRVLQEALQNAVKHSGVRQFEVLLRATSSEIQLRVHDSGVGFDLQKAIGGHGIGLISMKERMKLIDGHLSIDLKPEGGTTIRARVPLSPKVRSAGADG